MGGLSLKTGRVSLLFSYFERGIMRTEREREGGQREEEDRERRSGGGQREEEDRERGRTESGGGQRVEEHREWRRTERGGGQRERRTERGGGQRQGGGQSSVRLETCLKNFTSDILMHLLRSGGLTEKLDVLLKEKWFHLSSEEK